MAIEDKNNPGNYSVGIISDGKMYNSSVVARDRDRLREQVLVGLGWSIVHVWSTDWYRNKEETKKKLLETIKVLEIEKQLEKERLKEELMRFELDNEFESDEDIGYSERNGKKLIMKKNHFSNHRYCMARESWLIKILAY